MMAALKPSLTSKAAYEAVVDPATTLEVRVDTEKEVGSTEKRGLLKRKTVAYTKVRDLPNLSPKEAIHIACDDEDEDDVPSCESIRFLSAD